MSLLFFPNQIYICYNLEIMGRLSDAKVPGQNMIYFPGVPADLHRLMFRDIFRFRIGWLLLYLASCSSM